MKLVLKILAVLVLLVIVAAAALFFLLDPNIFKPKIEALARDQGVDLRINGELGWQFWPSIGLELNDITLAPLSEPEQLLATLNSASLLVATRPLLKKELVVQHLMVGGATVNLQVDDNGEGNWSRLKAAAIESEQIDISRLDPAQIEQVREQAVRARQEEAEAKEAAAPKAAATNTTGRELQLAVEKISIADVVLNYRDAAGTELTANLKALELTDFNAGNRPFGIDLKWQVSLVSSDPAAKPLALEGELSAQLQLAETLQQFVLSDAELELAIGPENQQTELVAALNADLSLTDTGVSYKGRLALEPTNLKALLASLGQAAPETANPDALAHLAVSGEFVGTDNSFTLAPLQLVLDKTILHGELAVTDLEAMALVVTLGGDAINVDDYLPPGSPEDPSTSDSAAASKPSPASAPGTSVATGDEPLIPLDLVKTLDAKVRLDMNQLIVSQLTFNDVRVRLTAAGGLVELTEFSTNTYDGRVNAEGSLDGRGNTALIKFSGAVAGLQLAPLLSDLELDEKVQLTGALNATAKGTTQGISQNALMQALVAEADFNGAQMRLAPINVEQYFCQLVSLVKDEKTEDGEATSEERTWPEYTEMQQLTGKIRMANEVITIESFTAGVAELALGTQGQVSLADDSYDLRLPLTLTQQSTSEGGCTVKSNYWIDRSLELLRCKGSLTDLAPLKDCRLDSKGVEKLIGQYAGQRLQQELLRKFGGKKDEDKTSGENAADSGSSSSAEGTGTEQKTDEKSGEKAVEDLLKSLLKPKEKK